MRTRSRLRRRETVPTAVLGKPVERKQSPVPSLGIAPAQFLLIYASSPVGGVHRTLLEQPRQPQVHDYQKATSMSNGRGF